VATVSTGLPGSGVLGRPIIGIAKSAGTTARALSVDLLWIYKIWPSSRYT
jgi:hypothetical protein